MRGKPAVFLDRDGTINVEAGYIRDLAEMHLMPGAADAIRQLNERGVLAILATNQSGPARGYYPETWVHALNDHVQALLVAEGAQLDDMFYCPHLPDGTVPEYTMDCRCRKPETGMLEDAAAKHGIDLAASYMIGDKATDVEVGQRAGCRTVLLRSGFGERVLSGEYQWRVEPDFVADTIVEAIAWVVADLSARQTSARG